MGKYSYHNAQEVLNNVEKMIEWGGTYSIREVYDKLSIFDWWPHTLNQGHLKQMRTFLNLAIKLGYTGYVCFKVGASGCANGMWAHVNESKDGYAPGGPAIYRSFTPDYTYYSIYHNDAWLPKKDVDGMEYDSLKTTKLFKDYIISYFYLKVNCDF